tara:strand:- start:363 stop:725 length:363 start_codon:yes stop_codon:yes gene_type:complete
MNVINWNKPKRARPKAEHDQLSFDGGPPGGYIPNMSREDTLKWRGKLIGGKDPRVEIRKSCNVGGTQILIVVRHSGKPERDKTDLRLSMNGTSELSFEEFTQMQHAINEAIMTLKEKYGN